MEYEIKGMDRRSQIFAKNHKSSDVAGNLYSCLNLYRLSFGAGWLLFEHLVFVVQPIFAWDCGCVCAQRTVKAI